MIARFTLRDLFWLILVAALVCALFVNTGPAMRVLLVFITAAAVACWRSGPRRSGEALGDFGFRLADASIVMILALTLFIGVVATFGLLVLFATFYFGFS